MTSVLVTGASGRLGRVLIDVLAREGFEVRAASRTARPSQDGVRWVVVDLTTGQGLAAAVDGVDVIVHLATAPYKGRYTDQVELGGTQRLLRAAGDRHVIYVSIVGVDRVQWAYYRSKIKAERLIEASGVPYTIVRATQFHEFVAQGFTLMTRFRIRVIDPGITVQPVDVRDVAAELVSRIRGGPLGGITEYGGPEVIGAGDLLETWLRARGRTGRVLRIRIPGRLGRAFRAGHLTTRAQPTGKITWSDYLAGH
ncbi:SDR family oxidoreductase [Nonomuraea sediminis]|uniref:SDR family oxidoreductase n=1 Tax=Nonomuraea sediminis TaxID=2835864 RepID=UPI001BDC7E13|nr:NAD(P)H-binding protein [Nonomuraea sediminis]